MVAGTWERLETAWNRCSAAVAVFPKTLAFPVVFSVVSLVVVEMLTVVVLVLPVVEMSKMAVLVLPAVEGESLMVDLQPVVVMVVVRVVDQCLASL